MQRAEKADRKGRRAATRPARPAMPDAEYRRLFIRLIDHTAMVRTRICLDIAERMGRHSAAAGWDEGVRVAGLLGEVYRDMSEMLDRPVRDGVMGHAMSALRDTLDYLRRFGLSYRDGTPVEHREYAFITGVKELAELRDERDLDPILALEKVRSKVADLRGEAAGMEKRRPEDGPQGRGYPFGWLDPEALSQTCRASLREDELDIRKDFGKHGEDYIFPPKAKSIVGMLAGYVAPGASSLDMVRETRSRGL